LPLREIYLARVSTGEHGERSEHGQRGCREARPAGVPGSAAFGRRTECVAEHSPIKHAMPVWQEVAGLWERGEDPTMPANGSALPVWCTFAFAGGQGGASPIECAGDRRRCQLMMLG
jgi:hypothetical protein